MVKDPWESWLASLEPNVREIVERFLAYEGDHPYESQEKRKHDATKHK